MGVNITCVEQQGSWQGGDHDGHAGRSMDGAYSSRVNSCCKCNRGSVFEDGADVSVGAAEAEAHHGQARSAGAAFSFVLRQLSGIFRLRSNLS